MAELILGPARSVRTRSGRTSSGRQYERYGTAAFAIVRESRAILETDGERAESAAIEAVRVRGPRIPERTRRRAGLHPGNPVPRLQSRRYLTPSPIRLPITYDEVSHVRSDFKRVFQDNARQSRGSLRRTGASLAVSPGLSSTGRGALQRSQGRVCTQRSGREDWRPESLSRSWAGFHVRGWERGARQHPRRRSRLGRAPTVGSHNSSPSRGSLGQGSGHGSRREVHGVSRRTCTDSSDIPTSTMEGPALGAALSNTAWDQSTSRSPSWTVDGRKRRGHVRHRRQQRVTVPRNVDGGRTWFRPERTSTSCPANQHHPRSADQQSRTTCDHHGGG